MEKEKLDHTNLGNTKTRQKSSLKFVLLLAVFFSIPGLYSGQAQTDLEIATLNDTVQLNLPITRLWFYTKSKQYFVNVFQADPKKIKTKTVEARNVVERFATFYIKTPYPERLFVVREQHLSGIRCKQRTWCEDRFFWMQQGNHSLQSISVTIDVLGNEHVTDYSLFHFTNERCYVYNLSVSTNREY
ncbi:hypothetical protein PoB_004309100 [Plakobranchus ocellatus]|uniref:Uncharacterized protein n=1 Tax=Plakobranchus ocellatus TaxID=259542 RepID=A0AAV4AZJ3_9GAST|nr:hypothetical protein PoB_004309100 [Plakobranchus ocellatus]